MRNSTNIRLVVKRGYKIYGLETEGEFASDPKINFRLKF